MKFLRSVALLVGYVDSSFSASQPNKMYAVGGCCGLNSETVEKYDPASDIWTPVASMLTNRSNLAVGVLTESDGKQYLYAVGGFQFLEGVGNSLQSVEKYDPASDIWTLVASMSTKRSSPAVGVLTESDGKQYLYAVGGSIRSSVEKYDSVSDIWTSVASMSTKRSGLAVGVLTESDGKQYMYAVGGSIIGTFHQSVEKYDPSRDIWTLVASMSTVRDGLAVGVLTDYATNKQYLYAVGGYQILEGVGNLLQSVEKYDPSKDIWTSVASMSTKRNGLAVGVMFQDNKQYLYAVGGSAESTVEKYDPASDMWTPVASMSTRRSSLAVGVITGVCNEDFYFVSITKSCAACESGFLCDGTSALAPCPAGLMCDNNFETISPVGFGCGEGTSNATKILCPSGHICDQGTSNATKTLCPAGYVCAEGTHNTTKVKCPAGFMCEEGTTPTTQKDVFCPAGYMCDAGTHSQNKDSCPAMYVCDEGATPDSKSLCPAGYFCDGYNHSGNIVKCPAGYFCREGTSNSTKGICPAGYVCPEGTTSLTKNKVLCPAGYVCDKGTTPSNQRDDLCPKNYVCDAGTRPDTKLDVPCPEGYECPLGTSSETIVNPTFDLPPEFIAAVSVFGVTMLADLIIVAYARLRRHHKEAKYLLMLSFPFGLLDFMLDCVFFSTSVVSEDRTIFALACASIGFIVIPFFLNMAFIVRIIRSELQDNSAFSAWFSDNSAPFIATVVLACTNAGGIRITNCGVGEFPLFSAPWSEAARINLDAMGLITNIGEDIPQIIIQIIFVIATFSSDEGLPQFISLSIATSILMVLNNALLRWLGLTNETNKRKKSTMKEAMPSTELTNVTVEGKGVPPVPTVAVADPDSTSSASDGEGEDERALRLKLEQLRAKRKSKKKQKP